MHIPRPYPPRHSSGCYAGLGPKFECTCGLRDEAERRRVAARQALIARFATAQK